MRRAHSFLATLLPICGVICSGGSLASDATDPAPTELAALMELGGLSPDARYIVFWCADEIRGWQYYESIDLIDAYHPQTILAYGMNGAALPVGHGAPLRLRVERQLGYKHAKFVTRIEAVTDLASVGYGKGGFWEDASGYEWYAGI